IMRGATFSRAFALAFEPSPALIELRKAVIQAVGPIDEAPFEPHVSLTYGAPPDADALTAAAAAFAGPMRFDALGSHLYQPRTLSQTDVNFTLRPDYPLMSGGT